MLTSYLRMGRYEANTCVNLLPRCGWVSGGNVLASYLRVRRYEARHMCSRHSYPHLGRRLTHVLASYLRVGRCRKEKCVNLLPRCG